jgi:hypothetical protein
MNKAFSTTAVLAPFATYIFGSFHAAGVCTAVALAPEGGLEPCTDAEARVLPAALAVGAVSAGVLLWAWQTEKASQKQGVRRRIRA